MSEPRRVLGTVARLQGEVTDLGDQDALEIRIRYRELNTDEWLTSDPVTVSDTRRFTVDLTDLVRQRYYRYYAVATVDGEKITSDRRLFGTPSGSSPHESQPWSDDRLGPKSGFASMAPWLNDNTPHVIVREPTRDQLETAFGVAAPRVVTFATSGTVDLGGEAIPIPNDRCWVAGQVAPDPGITLVNGELRIEGSRCVVQHLRVRPGDAGGSSDGEWAPSGIRVADGASDVVLDHCSVSWAVDSGVSVGTEAAGVTVSNCLVAEGLQNATHPDGRAGHGVVVGDAAGEVALLANAFAFNNGGHPELGSDARAAVANDLVHTYRSGVGLAGGSAAALVGGVFEDPRTDGPLVTGSGTVSVEDTTVGGNAPGVADGVSRVDSRPLWPEGLSPLAGDETKGHALANAGARPASRTDVDARIVENVRSGSGGYVDSQEGVGGFPSLPANEGEADPPESGVRLWLYQQASAVEPGE
ncbi:MAG: hypothetical protein ABEJ40_11975 [Haloarculaceae archaeon]